MMKNSSLAAAVQGARAGGADAESLLAREVYPQLRRMASQRLRQHQPLTLLDTAALVHESWLRMLGGSALDGADRAYFLAYAARTMRSIIVDHARARTSQKRGGGIDELPLDDDESLLLPAPQVPAEVLRLHDALKDLSRINPGLLMELQYLGARFKSGDARASHAAPADTVPVASEWTPAVACGEW